MLIYSTAEDLAPQLEQVNCAEGVSDKGIIAVMWVNGTFQSENNAERLNKLDNETTI